MSSLLVHGTLLHSFFEKATKDLEELSYNNDMDGFVALNQFRTRILQTQQSALSSVVRLATASATTSSSTTTTTTTTTATTIDEDTILATINQVQAQLQCMETHSDFKTLEAPMRIMTLTARQALARLVLQQQLKQHQHQHQQQQQQHKTPPPQQPLLTRSATVEFCGLSQATVQLAVVKRFLAASYFRQKKDESSLELFDTIIHETLLVPHERWHFLQKLIFHAMGYPNADLANQQLYEHINKEEFQRNDQNDDGTSHIELKMLFDDTIEQIRSALAIASIQMQQEELNDFQQGGVTRVISVSHSESNNNNYHHNNNDIGYADEMGTSSSPATMNRMERSHDSNHDDSSNRVEQQQEQNTVHAMARQTAALEQTLLARLLQMEEEERAATLEQARVAHCDLMDALANLTTGSERVAYMTSSAVSMETQQLLLMHQIWQELLARNGGHPPTMASSRDRDY